MHEIWSPREENKQNETQLKAKNRLRPQQLAAPKTTLDKFRFKEITMRFVRCVFFKNKSNVLIL